MWYSWTAPYSGPAEFSTAGSAFDTLLALHSGSGVGLAALTRLAVNDDCPAR